MLIGDSGEGKTPRKVWLRFIASACGYRKPLRFENAGFGSVREIIMVATMTPFFIALLALVTSTFRTRAAQQAEIVALRHLSPSCNKARHVVSAFGHLTGCCGFGCPVSGRPGGT